MKKLFWYKESAFTPLKTTKNQRHSFHLAQPLNTTVLVKPLSQPLGAFLLQSLYTTIPFINTFLTTDKTVAFTVCNYRLSGWYSPTNNTRKSFL